MTGIDIAAAVFACVGFILWACLPELELRRYRRHGPPPRDWLAVWMPCGLMIVGAAVIFAGRVWG